MFGGPLQVWRSLLISVCGLFCLGRWLVHCRVLKWSDGGCWGSKLLRLRLL